MTPTVILPMLSLANSAETSESAASIPLTGRAGAVWQTALPQRNAQHAADITNIFERASRAVRRFCNLLVIDVLIGI